MRWAFRALLMVAALALPPTISPAQDGLLDGAPVVKRIVLADVPPATEQRFWLAAGSTPLGQPYRVPVIVVQGQAPGPRLWISAAVHGDELNGVRVVQRLVAETDPGALAGTLIAVPAINLPGIAAHSRFFPLADDGGSQADLNRLWPGDDAGGNAADRFAADIWNGLARGQVDLAVDLHTQSRGAAFPVFVFADLRDAEVERLARALGPDMLKRDRGTPGSLETAFMAAGVAAVTLEIGGPKHFDAAMIERALGGLRNVMIVHGMIEGEAMAMAEPFVGNQVTTVRAAGGGLAEVLVGLGEDVVAGQPVARQLDLFGDPIATYAAPEDGRVLSIATDPVREPGAMLVRLLRQEPDGACAAGC